MGYMPRAFVHNQCVEIFDLLVLVQPIFLLILVLVPKYEYEFRYELPSTVDNNNLIF